MADTEALVVRSRPVTPSTGGGGGLAMTEYTANPSPPNSPRTQKRAVSKQLPEDFILPDGNPDYLRLIHNSSVYDVVETTELTRATNLSRRYEANIMLKREDLQPVFSFKLRGAYNKMASLTPLQRWKGVVACSAGNHAQGVAYSARHLKVPATIVMPKGTPAIKHLNVGRLGGNVVLHGDDFDAAKAECQRLEKLHGLTSIPPFDDPYVIAGQGTIGLELMTQTSLRKLEAVFCCVGGGGLIAGIGVFLKRIAPHIKIIGVEHDGANAMVQSLKEGKRVFLKDVGLFADGAAVKTVGEETFRICKDVIDDMIEVTTDETCAAIKDFYDETRSTVEPAGALALAGLKKYVQQNPSENRDRGLVAIMSGANMNFSTLRFVADRAALGENKEVLLSVVIPEEPGSFARLVDAVLPRAVTEFGYRYNNGKPANILMAISVNAQTRHIELPELIHQLNMKGMPATDVSDDEEAKTLVRYFVGGRSNVPNERLYMFEFPERPGALAKFLKSVRPGQTITLFSYRASGGDVSRIWAGIQCPEEDKPELEQFLRKLGYPFRDRTKSAPFQTYLRD